MTAGIGIKKKISWFKIHLVNKKEKYLNMRTWKIERITTFSDDILANKLNEIESNPKNKIKEIIYMGNNMQGIRIYQIIYVEE